MKALDRFLQSWRIRKARRFIRAGDRVLDVGSSDGPLFRQIPGLGAYVGVDPDLPGDRELASNAWLRKGYFPAAVKAEERFDCITMLAVLEHIPPGQQVRLASDCAAYLKPGGHLVVTVPAPVVDRILAILKRLRLIDGMSVEEHYGYDATLTPGLFCGAGFRLHSAKRFQFGVNNLFVFIRN